MTFCIKCESEIDHGEQHFDWNGAPFHNLCLLEALLERIEDQNEMIEREKQKLQILYDRLRRKETTG